MFWYHKMPVHTLLCPRLAVLFKESGYARGYFRHQPWVLHPHRDIWPRYGDLGRREHWDVIEGKYFGWLTYSVIDFIDWFVHSFVLKPVFNDLSYVCITLVRPSFVSGMAWPQPADGSGFPSFSLVSSQHKFGRCPLLQILLIKPLISEINASEDNMYCSPIGLRCFFPLQW